MYTAHGNITASAHEINCGLHQRVNGFECLSSSSIYSRVCECRSGGCVTHNPYETAVGFHLLSDAFWNAVLKPDFVYIGYSRLSLFNNKGVVL